MVFAIPKPVLVTGGAGYIGSHVCKALAEAGAQPVCLDTLEKGHDWAVRWGALERGDVGDAAFIDEVFRRHRPRVVIHLAGYIEVGESVAQPERYLHNNAAKSRILIEAAVRNRVEAFVFSSTCAVYGLPQSERLSEEHDIAPINPYAASKASVERALDAAATRGLRSASLRYFNATGADAEGEIGEAHDPETHLLPLAVDAALGLREPLVVHGCDYPTPDGSCVRDFVHVTDLADAHLRAVRWLLHRNSLVGCHQAFNLGSGTGYSVREVIAAIGRIAGQPVPHNSGPRRPGDSPQLVGCITKAQRELDWLPSRGLETQIEDTLRWRRSMQR
ncbi:MAG: UDP-glucose 4-epimerase GalE [Alphaproteobacteria bacterium]|nr:UDP-glucose 4-epimerase GalE [Alphaproteobacteria bacterium]MBV8406060.1 UDP-glucose 4-epimerase GalE [Alphaproteobacteria bacterium]